MKIDREAVFAVTGFLGFNVSLILIFAGATLVVHAVFQNATLPIPTISQEIAWIAVGSGILIMYLSFRLTKLADSQKKRERPSG